jgi:methyl-accepting chemotaxis protein
VKYRPPQQGHSAETAATITRLKDRIKRLEEAGNELRECASRIGTVASGEGSVIRRTQDAIQAWEKEAKL